MGFGAKESIFLLLSLGLVAGVVALFVIADMQLAAAAAAADPSVCSIVGTEGAPGAQGARGGIGAEWYGAPGAQGPAGAPVPQGTDVLVLQVQGFTRLTLPADSDAFDVYYHRLPDSFDWRQYIYIQALYQTTEGADDRVYLDTSGYYNVVGTNYFVPNGYPQGVIPGTQQVVPAPIERQGFRMEIIQGQGTIQPAKSDDVLSKGVYAVLSLPTEGAYSFGRGGTSATVYPNMRFHLFFVKKV